MPLANFVSGLANAGKQMGEQLSAQVERHRNPDGTPASATTPGAPGAEAKSGGGLAGLRTTMRQGFVELDPRQSPHTLKLQVAIRAQRSCVSDHDALGRDSQTLSKALVSWGEQQPQFDEVKDTSDRIAYLLYKAGEAHSNYASSLEQSRSALKDLRNFESKLNARRDKRAELRKRIDNLTTQHAKQPKHGQEIESLQQELAGLERDDAAEEASVESMKRQKLKEMAVVEFDAMQRLGEQLALVAAHGKALAGSPYDAARAGQVKSAAQRALDSWTPAKSFTPHVQLGAAGLDRSDTQSFASTHSAELAKIKLDDHSAAHESYYSTPAAGAPSHLPASAPIHQPYASTTPDVGHQSPPMPINMQPTPLTHPASPPLHSTSPPLRQASDEHGSVANADHDAVSATPHPTMAETGVPLAGNPGPKTGQLSPSPSTAAQSEAARRKQEEARQELQANFGALSGSSGQASTSNVGQPGGAEQLPAYSSGA